MDIVIPIVSGNSVEETTWIGKIKFGKVKIPPTNLQFEFCRSASCELISLTKLLKTNGTPNWETFNDLLIPPQRRSLMKLNEKRMLD